MGDTEVRWTDYLMYRAHLRGFRLEKIEYILRHTTERYVDLSTGSHIAVGLHENQLVMIPYEVDGSALIPVTIHATSRQQISFRLKAGRFRHEKNAHGILREG